jgi:hypothetical protein
MGYSPFILDEISFEIANVKKNPSEKTALVSSKLGRPKDNKIGLHIGLSDAISFVNKLREIGETSVYLTHYDWNNIDDLKATATELGYFLLTEGENKL